VIASSETTYGVFLPKATRIQKLPLEEDYDTDPMDSYGLSKVVNEKTARASPMRYGSTSMRADRDVIGAHEYDMFPASWPICHAKTSCWGYIDAALARSLIWRSRRTGSAFRSFSFTTLESP